jgi:predicted dehydrogenase
VLISRAAGANECEDRAVTLPSGFPPPELPAPDTVPPLRWGIVGPGEIAAVFAESVRAHTRQQLTAVSSRSPDRAAAFAARFGIPEPVGSVEALVARADVDVVYVATQQHVHDDAALAAIAAGKHVLIEKPLAITAARADAILAAGRAAGVLVMEAMWTRYLPQASIIRRLVADGVLGEIRLVQAEHAQYFPPGHRLFDPESGGGALLDLGIYPFAFASGLLGEPESSITSGSLAASGVDAQSVTVQTFTGGAQAVLSTGLLAKSPLSAFVAGTSALLEVHAPFFLPTGLTLSDDELFGSSVSWTDTSGISAHQGLSYQATALASFVADGAVESPVHSHAETVAVLRRLDAARHALGFRFAGE